MKNKVGIKIKKFRKEKGITQEELANRVNKSTITIRKYEAGEIFPSIANIKTIAEVLEVDPYKDILDDAQPIEAIEPVKEAIDHPSHYNMGKYEAIDVIEDWNLGFNLGNTIKYISRAGHKDKDKTIEDLKKSLWYLQREIDNLEGKYDRDIKK